MTQCRCNFCKDANLQWSKFRVSFVIANNYGLTHRNISNRVSVVKALLRGTPLTLFQTGLTKAKEDNLDTRVDA